MSRRRLLPALALAALAAAAAGCVNNDELIRVGNRVVTVDDFKAVARGNESNYPGTPDEAKLALFDDLLRRELMLREAEERGLFKDTLVTKNRAEAESQLLQRTLFERIVARDLPVSAAEAKQLVAWRDTSSQMLVIYSPERAVANAARAALDAGEDFGAVANRFNAVGALPPGGDLGMMLPGSLVPPLDDLLRTAPLNTVVGPVAAPGEGWFIVKVVARQYNAQPAPESQLGIVTEMIRQKKQRMVAVRASESLRAAYRLTVAPGAPQSLYTRANAAAAEQMQGFGGVTMTPTPTADDEATTLAAWDGAKAGSERYSVADALRDIARGDVRPPTWSSIPAVRSWIDSQALRRIVLAEAKRRGLDQDPDVKRQIDGRVDSYVLEALYASDIAPEATASDDQVRAYYETVKDGFTKLREATFDAAILPESPLAQQVSMHASHAASLADALAMAGANAQVQRVTVRYPTNDPRWQNLEPTFTSLPAGGPAGPMQIAPNAFLVLKLVSKVQPPMAYDELMAGTVMQLRDRVSEGLRDEVLKKHTEHYKKMYSPVLHPERLKRIPWPIEGALAAQAAPATP